MTLIELKKSLHEKIDDLDDLNLLEQAAALLSLKNGVFIVPEYMKEGIRQGIEDGKNGRIHSMEDFDEKYAKWLKNNLY